MQKRTWKIALIAAMLAMVVALCGACSGDMLSYWKTLYDINSQQYLEESGTLTFGVESKELSDMLKEEGLSADLLEKMTLKYTGKTDQKNMRMELDATLTVDGKDFPLTMYLDDMTLYFNAAGVLNTMQVLATTEEAKAEYEATKALFGDTAWLKLDLLSAEEKAEFAKALDAAQSEVGKVYTEEVLKMMNALDKAFSGFDSDVFSASGKTYTLKLDNKSCAKLFSDLIAYTVQNADTVAAALNEYVEGSTLIEATEKKEFIDTMNEFAAACKDEATDVDVDAGVKELQDMINTGLSRADMPKFDLTYDLTKNSSTSYTEKMDCSMTMPAAMTGSTSDMKIYMQVNSDIKAVNTLAINVPQGAADVEKLIEQGRAKAYPTGVSATIYLDDDYMYYTKYYDCSLLDDTGMLTPGVRVVNNTTYLPLRAIGEACGEDVFWDSAKKQAYVQQGEKKIYVTGFTDAKAGRSYLKVRDFEKLGYTVNYSADTGVVDMTK